MDRKFRDRVEAGGLLAEALAEYAGRDDVVVLALPRGGVPVGREVADALGAPLDVLIVRKLGAPGQPELAMGAIASGGFRVLNREVVRPLGIGARAIERVEAEERAELERRERAYRGDRAPVDVTGKTVILVDDGAATGSTLRVALRAVRERDPARVVVAVPTSARETCDRLREEADEAVCVRTPEPFIAIGAWYQEFPQVSDAEVRDLLGRSG